MKGFGKVFRFALVEINKPSNVECYIHYTTGAVKKILYEAGCWNIICNEYSGCKMERSGYTNKAKISTMIG